MARFGNYAPTEDVPESRDIDRVFLGVRQINPGEIPPGFVADARNCRFTQGEAAPRLGVAKLPWTNRINSQSKSAQPFGKVYGAEEFNEALGITWLIVAADGKVYRCQQFAAAVEIALPPGVTITRDVTFTQTANGLVMWRGTERPLIMPNLETGFVTMTKQANAIEGDSTENPTNMVGSLDIPPAERGDWIGNRLFFPYKTESELDLLGITDYLNATRFPGVRNQGRINQGSSDRLLRVVQVVDNVAICFKEASIYVLENVKYDLSTMTLSGFTDEYGLCSHKAVANTGKDLWFLAPKRGVVSVRLTEQNKLQGEDIPKSFMIQNTIDRINWRVASRTATAAYFANKFYLAVPLDDATQQGANQVSGSFDGGGLKIIDVIPGDTYRWKKGGSTNYLLNGLEVLTDDGDFVAAGTTVQLSGGGDALIEDEFRRVFVDSNNAVLVYDFTTQEWAGMDDGCVFCVKDWVTATFNGVKRLMFVGEDGFINCIEELFYDECAYWSLSSTDLTTGLDYNLDSITIPVEPGTTYRFVPGFNFSTLENGFETYDGTKDFVAASNTVRLVDLFGDATEMDASLRAHVWTPSVEYIDYDWTSRGYGGDTISRKKWSDLEMHAATWFPSYQVLAKSEGYNTEVQVTPDEGWQTKSATTYDDPWDARPWNPSNPNDDHQTPGRQDYSLVVGETTIPPVTGTIRPNLVYFVESSDVTSDCSILYNGQTIPNQTTFTGVAGQTSFTIVSGTPLVYPPGSYVDIGDKGMVIDQHQEFTEGLRIPPAVRGRVVQLRFRCRQGRMIVRGIGPEGTFSSRSKGERT